MFESSSGSQLVRPQQTRPPLAGFAASRDALNRRWVEAFDPYVIPYAHGVRTPGAGGEAICPDQDPFVGPVSRTNRG